MIAVNEGGIESILRIKEVLDRKEYVCFQGDRFVEGSPTVTLPFMGHEAPFPAGPFAVAGKFRVPVVFYYAMRERGRRYRAHAAYCSYRPTGTPRPTPFIRSDFRT